MVLNFGENRKKCLKLVHGKGMMRFTEIGMYKNHYLYKTYWYKSETFLNETPENNLKSLNLWKNTERNMDVVYI